MNKIIRLDELDPFDPNNWPLLHPPHECRIYGDDDAQTWAVVSPQWYQACVKHRWRWKKSDENKGSKKKYLSRNRHVNHGNGGAARHNRTQANLFLHTFIMELRGLPKPSKRHIVDHRDGDETNCTDENLRWATPKLNRANQRGSHASKEHDECHKQQTNNAP